MCVHVIRFATIIYFVTCLCVISTGLFFLYKQTRLRKNGVPAKGFIYSRGSRFLYVRFVTKGGKWVTGKSYIKGIYEEGDTVTVYYNPSNADDFIVDNRQTTLRIYGLIAIGVLVLLSGIAMVYFTKHLIPFHT